MASKSRVVKYEHHGQLVSVLEEDKGKHSEHCLCYQNCAFFIPDDRESNCPIANALYRLDVLANVVTPVWECAEYEAADNV